MKVSILLYTVILFIIGFLICFLSVFREGFQSKDLTFGVMAIFKNEAMGIREWIEHYKWQGADKILLLDNNSTDDWRDKITGFEHFVTVLAAPNDHYQSGNYRDIGIPWLKENGIDIVVTLDIDEFMFGADGRLLKEYIIDVFSSANRPSQFTCKWTMFGSSGHITQPSDIRTSFTWKKSDLVNLTKPVTWVNDIRDIQNPHGFEVTGETQECPSGIQLNHYAIQSREYFEKIKMTRGDVVNSVNLRDWHYFTSYDYREEEDVKLKDLLERM